MNFRKFIFLSATVIICLTIIVYNVSGTTSVWIPPADGYYSYINSNGVLIPIWNPPHEGYWSTKAIQNSTMILIISFIASLALLTILMMKDWID